MQKTAYEMRISDWSSYVCSSDLRIDRRVLGQELGDQGSVLAVPLHAQHQGLETTHGQVGIERAGHGTRAVLQERERGVEFLVTGEQRAADDVGMPAAVLRRRVQHAAGTAGPRPLQRRRGKGVN